MKRQTSYRFELRKGSRKDVCPSCGHKTFVPYVYTGTTDVVGSQYGRCDREQKCGYFRYPTDVQPREVVAQTPPPLLTPLRMNDRSPLINSLYKPSTLKRWAADLYGDTDEVVSAFADYLIGGTDDGATIFWQVDCDNNIRSGKIMRYKSDGHREHGNFSTTWAHAANAFKASFVGVELQQCFFGEHLLPRYPDKAVAVVESEKTAVLMSVFYPKALWLSCGGLHGLNSSKCAALQGRRVVLFPDKGCYDTWRKPATLYGFKLAHDVEELDGLQMGDDIFDYVEKALKQ